MRDEKVPCSDIESNQQSEGVKTAIGDERKASGGE